MSTLKTLENDNSVKDFIEKLDDDTKKQDCFKLVELFEKWTGYKSKLWGTSIIGYGKYHYKSDRSTQEGDWPLTGFSPRKQNISLYIMPGFGTYTDLLAKIGKHKVSTGSCLYIKKLADIDLNILEKLVKESVVKMKKDHKID